MLECAKVPFCMGFMEFSISIKTFDSCTQFFHFENEGRLKRMQIDKMNFYESKFVGWMKNGG